MDSAKSVDRTNMSLDDIIKMDRQSNIRSRPFKNSNSFAKNSINRAKLNAVNKRTAVSFNRNRLGLVNKRNIIKTNIVISKRNNLNARVNTTIPRVNERRNDPLNVISKSFSRNDILHSAPAIRITAPNDQHQAFKRNNTERGLFNRNINDNWNTSLKKSFTTKPFRDHNQRSVNQNNIRSNNNKSSWNLEHRPMPPPRQPDYARRSINDSGNKRHTLTQSNNFKDYSSTKDSFRRSENQNSKDRLNSHRNKYYDQEYRKGDRDNFERKPDRSQDREYEAMARALIEAHRDSRNKSYQPRYDNAREYDYRR